MQNEMADMFTGSSGGAGWKLSNAWGLEVTVLLNWFTFLFTLLYNACQSYSFLHHGDCK